MTLPIDSSGTSLKGKLRPIVINVLKDGSYMVRAQEMKLDQIEQLLMETVDKSQTRKCSCARIGETPFKHVAAVDQVAKVVGIPKANIAFKVEP